MVKSRFVCGWTHSLSPGLRFLNLEVNPTQPCLSFSSWSSLCWPPTQLSPGASCPCFGATENQGSVLGPFSLVGQPHPLTLLNNLVPYILKKMTLKETTARTLLLNLGRGGLRTRCPALPGKVTAVIGVPAPRFSHPSLPCVSFPLAHKHTLFPSLKHTKQHPFLDFAPPFGCHLVSLLPFQTMLPERVSANSFLSACHLAFTLAAPGEVLQPRAPHDFLLPKSKHLSWLLDLPQSGHSLPLDLPPVLPLLQHLTLLITPSRLKFDFIWVRPGLRP